MQTANPILSRIDRQAAQASAANTGPGFAYNEGRTAVASAQAPAPAPAVEAAQPAEEPKPEPVTAPEPALLSKDEFLRIVEEFGAPTVRAELRLAD